MAIPEKMLSARLAVVAALVALVASLWAPAAAESPAAAAPLPTSGIGAASKGLADVRLLEDQVYAEHAGVELRLDLALPPEGAPGPYPALLFLHGGGWRAGNREVLRAAIRQMAERGYAAATASYRFTTTHAWPAQLDDVRAALRWLRSSAAQHGIDPRRIGASGFSAGGHLSLLLGLAPEKDEAGIQAVVNYFGPTDLRTDVFNDDVDRLLEALAGGPRAERAEVYADASPVVHVSRGDAPVLTFHGTEDPLVPVDQARALHRSLQEARIPNALDILEGRGHGWVGADLERTQARALEFFDLYLRGSDLPLLAAEDFAEGAGRWAPTDAAAWRVATVGELPVYSLLEKSGYRPPVRSPESFALLADIEVTDFVLDVRVRSTTRDYGHRDVCFIFGHRDPSHFYYAHIAKAADPNAHSIFLVNGEPRVGIARERTEGIDWDDAWHRVRIRRDTSSGSIEVFFDDMARPIMRTIDSTFLRGRVGIGSFDDTADFTEIRLRGRTELPTMTL